MPFRTVDELKDGTLVRVHYIVCGNPKGIPVVYLHGGPGDAITPAFKKMFDLNLYHVLMFDQRGCGKSEPRNHLEKNTTPHLLQDIEGFRENVMGVEKWVVAGGSWGSSLALLYAEKWPCRCAGLILRGLFDLDVDACNAVLYAVYPENKARLDELVPYKTRREFYAKSRRILQGKKSSSRRRQLVDALNPSDPLYVYGTPGKETVEAKETFALLGNHYESHGYFVPNRAIYKDLGKIQHIPTLMLQGRYDVVCPMSIAYALSRRLPNSELRVVRSGHSMYEPEMIKALHQASKDMAVQVQRTF
jgi:proline iminopeptidase